MPRLTPQEWRNMRARYEVEGCKQAELAREYGINQSVVLRRAKAEGWQQAGQQPLAKAKAHHIAELVKIEEQKANLPIETQRAIDFLARKELELQEVSFDFRQLLFAKGRELLMQCGDVDKLMTLAKVHNEIARPAGAQPSTVNQIAIGDVTGKGGEAAKGGPGLNVILNGVAAPKEQE